MGSGCSSQAQIKNSDSSDKIKDIKENKMFASSPHFPRELDESIIKDNKDIDEAISAQQSLKVPEVIEESIDDEEKEKDAEKEDDAKQSGKDMEEKETKQVEKKVKEAPFTDEELANFKTELFKKLRERCKNALSCDPYKDEDGEFVVKIRNAVLKLSQSYFALKRTTQKEISSYRKEVASLIVETNIIDLVCEIVEWTYKNGWFDDDLKKQSVKYLPLSNSLLILLNFSDASATFAIELAKRSNLLQLMKTIVVDYTDRHLEKVEPKLKTTEHNVMKWCMSIIHNMSMVEFNVNALRDVGMIETLQPLLQSQTEVISISALASLSGIINEKECEIINGNKYIVMNLLDMLKKGQTKKDHRHQGWSCKECTFTIRNLARNDANKKLLVDLGALELLVNLGRNGNIEEQHESVEAIWALSFDEDNQALIAGNQDLGVIELLMDLKKSEHVQIKRACNGALWTLKDALKNTVVEKYKLIGEKLAVRNEPHVPETVSRPSLKKKATQEKSSAGHIMISYQWADQAVLKDVRDNMKASGFKVWMDIDQMGGSTLQAMAEAVEGADIFLMCMSSKYKNSLPCRAEAEYAYQTKKLIIPLKMEKGYCPDGWLGFILGTKLFYEFSGKYPFEQKMGELLKEILSVRGRLDSVDAGEVIKPSAITVTHSIPPVVQHTAVVSSTPNKTFHSLSVSMETVAAIRQWTSTDVSEWIKKNNLSGCGVDRLTCGEIAVLAHMRFECPDYFYKCLQEMLLVKDLLTMSKIVWALNDLSEHK